MKHVTIPAPLILAVVVAMAVSIHSTAQAEKFQMAGMSSELPEGWKQAKPDNTMQMAKFTVPGKGNATGEVVIFRFPGGSGTVEQNFARQEGMFEAPKDGKLDVKTSKMKVGGLDADYQIISGTYLDKFPPFAPNPKITRKEDYTQLYVVFKGTGGEYYVRMRGDQETVKANKEAFEEWLKNFK